MLRTICYIIHTTHKVTPTMSHKYFDFGGFDIDRALIDFNGHIEQVASFASQNEDKASFLKAYREKVKQWMRENHKNMKWMASQIGMSEGSTKNLLYNNINITTEKLVAIQKAMDEGLERTDSSITWLVLRVYEDISKLADFAAWSMAVEIPFSCFNECNLENTGTNARGAASVEDAEKIAAWATPLLMKEAASVLRPFYEQKSDTLFQITKKETALMREMPHGHLGGDYGFDIFVHGCEGGTFPMEEYAEIQLPVVAAECQVLYIELAASLKNMSIEEWVITTLNKEAKTQGLANLEAFINQHA